jgi:hypothetical protein
MKTPAMHRIVRKAKRLTPQSTPRLINIGRENMTAPAANVALARSFAANNDAEYLGYVKGRYRNMHWMMVYNPAWFNPTPMMLTIQCTDGRAVQASHRVSA